MTLETGVTDFDQFCGATARRVVRHAYALTGNLADAQDVAQEAFARAWQRWDSVRACESPEAWVRRVATNLATSRLRRDRTARAAAHQLVASDVPEISPDTVALVAALRTLPERQRVVLVLHYLADLPVGQVAVELGCSIGSVKAWLSPGRMALAAPVPPAARVLARGRQRQRRRRARTVAAACALAVVAAGASAAAYSSAVSHSRPAPAADHRTGKPGPVHKPTLPPAGQTALVLGLSESSQLVMTRIGSTVPPVTIHGVQNVSTVATDPGGGWVIAYDPSPLTDPRSAAARLAMVTESGRVQPFGGEIRKGWAVTGLAVRPDGSSIAVALWHIAVNRLPGQIRLVPLPGHTGSTRTWTLGSALTTQAWSLSWQNDTHLTYIPGSDETGGGFAPMGAVTLNTARSSSIAPAVSLWPPFTKKAGQCHLLSGTWLANGSGYLTLQACGGDTGARLGLASVKTGAAAGPTVAVPGFGCPAGQPLAPQPGGRDVLISFCGVSLENGGHISEVPGVASDAAWAG